MSAAPDPDRGTVGPYQPGIVLWHPL